eukprot:scaffold11624_cov70-Cylindrotheca_fusiformis.AAC.1
MEGLYGTKKSSGIDGCWRVKVRESHDAAAAYIIGAALVKHKKFDLIRPLSKEDDVNDSTASDWTVSKENEHCHEVIALCNLDSDVSLGCEGL